MTCGERASEGKDFAPLASCSRECSEGHQYNTRCSLIRAVMHACLDEYDELTECRLPKGHSGDHEVMVTWP